VARALADLSDFGLLEKQSSQKFVITCLGRRRTAMQNLTPLALLWVGKSISVKTNTQNYKQTITDIYTLLMGMGV